MPNHRLLLVSIAAGALLSTSTALRGQELSSAEKTLSAELQRCPAQKAERCHAAALQQFETSLRRESATPGAAYWGKVLTVLKRHSPQLDAEIRAAEKSAPSGATGSAASSASKLDACIRAGGTRAECMYWIVVLGGGR
jgi:hypothetical protein